MTINELFQVCQIFADMGSATQEQLHDLIYHSEENDINPNIQSDVIRFLNAARKIGLDEEDYQELMASLETIAA